MIVVDASAALELVLNRSLAGWVADRVFSPAARLHAPELIDLEVAHVLRRYEQRDEASAARVEQAMDAFTAMAIERHAHLALLPRVWSMRHNVTAYDASYVALAESLGAVLVTCDRRLGAIAGRHARVESA